MKTTSEEEMLKFSNLGDRESNLDNNEREGAVLEIVKKILTAVWDTLNLRHVNTHKIKVFREQAGKMFMFCMYR